MRLKEIWRYPVKSFQGERLETATLDAGGIVGDRQWSIRDVVTGKVLTGRREPRLLMAAARLEREMPRLLLPDGTAATGTGPATDASLSAWLGRPVTLASSVGSSSGVGEYFEDATDDDSRVIEWTMPAGRFVDTYPLLVLTTASLRAGVRALPGAVWDVRRFRPNLLIDTDDEGWVEDGWRGQSLGVGPAQVLIEDGCGRCTMVTRAQPGIEPDLDVYRTLARLHGATFGVGASVVAGGTIDLLDTIELARRAP